MIDLAALLVEDLLRVSVGSEPREDCMPYVELLSRSSFVSERQLVVVEVASRCGGVPQVIAHARLIDGLMSPDDLVGALIRVEVDIRKGSEIDGIGAGGESSVVMIRIEHLNGEGFPSAR